MNNNFSFHTLWQMLLPLYEAHEAQAIMRMVLEYRFGFSLTDIACGEVERLTEVQQKELISDIIRLKNNEPVQYVLGNAWFCDRSFHVEPGVLIPRPETEQLCRIIIKDYTNNNHTHSSNSNSKNILDIGTGSGCIAITLALGIPNAKVNGIDISSKALRIAKANAERLGANVTFHIGNALSLLPTSEENKDGEHKSEGGGETIIVSNPPYITESERQEMSKNVLEHEPELALFVPDDDPLLFYRSIGSYATKSLANNGSLYFEINPRFAKELKNMLFEQDFSNVEIINDNFGKQRFIRASFVE